MNTTFEPFYRFTADADPDGGDPTSAQLDIYDAIGNFDEYGEVSAKAFAKDLAKLPTSVRRLDIHINSPGGSIYDAQAIYSKLADHRATKIVYVDGLAASAASVVAMVGHKVYIRANANMMIHLPSGLTIGDKNEHEKSMRALQSIEDGMINTYVKKTGLERAEIERMLSDETWMNAEQAVEKGFADEVRGVIKTAAVGDTKRIIADGREFDLAPFKYFHVPALTATTQTKERPMTPAKPNAETAAGTPTDPNDGKGTPAAPAPPPPLKKDPPPADPPPAAATTTVDPVAAERQRVTALLALDRPATHDIITAAIKDGKQVADVVGECMQAMDNAAKQNARRVDAHQLDGIPPAGGAEGNDFGGRIKAAVDRQVKANRPRPLMHGRN